MGTYFNNPYLSLCPPSPTEPSAPQPTLAPPLPLAAPPSKQLLPELPKPLPPPSASQPVPPSPVPSPWPSLLPSLLFPVPAPSPWPLAQPPPLPPPPLLLPPPPPPPPFTPCTEPRPPITLQCLNKLGCHCPTSK